MIPPLAGLVLSGGLSTRMGRDKGAIIYHDVDQRSHCHLLLKAFCDEVFVSVRKGQQFPADLNPLFDQLENLGPAAGLLSAFDKYPDSAWLVLACDMPQVTHNQIALLVSKRNTQKAATVFTYYKDDGSKETEPLFAIWEHAGLLALKDQVDRGDSSPRKALLKLDLEEIESSSDQLRSLNSPSYKK